jgi:hypothetical protein
MGKATLPHHRPSCRARLSSQIAPGRLSDHAPDAANLNLKDNVPACSAGLSSREFGSSKRTAQMRWNQIERSSLRVVIGNAD